MWFQSPAFLEWSRKQLLNEQNIDLIINTLDIDNDACILEVGCGRTAKLSRILSDKGFKITGIDPKIELQSNADIIYIKDYFDYKQNSP